MEKIYRQVLLYDFYGELLKEHQKAVYEEAVCNDLSLSEIAQQQGISRQGVHDMIKRCDKILEDYENKLHLVQKYMDAGEKVQQILSLCKEVGDADERLQKIESIAEKLSQDF